jgi:D-beta-D-heptose 7-phosphate kinase/D-beta-D-heptose 1-phosphate adenosyltransferase
MQMQHSLLGLLERLHQAHVLVLGDLMLDRFVYGVAERISPEAPIPVLAVERVADMLGGAANVARNICTLGASATLVSVIGDDTAAESIRDLFSRTPGIEARVVVDVSRPTTTKTRHVADRQQIMRSDVESRAPITPDIAEEVMKEVTAVLGCTDIVLLSDYGKGVLSQELIQAVISAARVSGKPVLVDPKARSFARYKGASVITPNRNELQIASGMECVSDEEVVNAAEFIMRQIGGTVVVTRGQDGMTIVRQDAPPLHMRTVAVDVFDVSGAGDTAIATLATALAVDASIEDATTLANYAAGVVVGKPGTAAVTCGEILSVLDEGRQLNSPSGDLSLEDTKRLVDHWRDMQLKIAFTNGCFDLLHPGHISLLAHAKGMADKLIVGLNSDASVKRLKGPKRPIQSQAGRAAVLASLRFVDAVVIFDEDTPLRVIETLLPDVLVKGADYTIDNVVGADLVRSRGGKVVLATLVPSESTTKTLLRIADTQK